MTHLHKLASVIYADCIILTVKDNYSITISPLLPLQPEDQNTFSLGIQNPWELLRKDTRFCSQQA